MIQRFMKFKISFVYPSIMLFYFGLLLPYLEPQIFKTAGYEAYDRLYAVMKLISALVVIVLYLYIKKLHFSKYVLTMTAMQLWIFASTIINNGSLTRFAGPAIISVVILMLGELIAKQNWLKFLVLLRNFLMILLIINFLSQLINFFVFGKANLTTFLGIDNRWIYFYLPLVFISLIVSQLKYNKMDLLSIIIIVVSIISLFLAKSIGAILAMSTFIVMYGLYRYFSFCAVTYFVFYCIFDYFLVKGYILQSFSFFIQDLMSKDVTLSGRTYLWKTVVEVLESNPLWGMGVQSSIYDCNYFFEQSGNVIGCFVNHPHNYFLNIAYHGGIPALILFIYLYFCIVKKVDLIKNKSIKRIVISCLSAFFVASLVDTLDFSLFYFFIPLITYMLNDENLVLI